jgi:UDP-N-acetylmuramyl tripeptide synthase
MGMFSIYNALSAIAFALREQIPPDIIVNALGKVSGYREDLKPLIADRIYRGS